MYFYTPNSRAQQVAVWDTCVKRLKRLNPIALWSYPERSGTVAYDVSGYGRNGVHSNVTLGQPGIGDRGTSALYVPGSNSYTDLFTPSLAGAFNGTAGTIIFWQKANAGLWTAAQSYFFLFGANATNYIHMRQHGVNVLRWEYVAGGILKVVVKAAYNPTTWKMYALTWNKNAGASGEMMAFIDGQQEGTTVTGLGIWAGNPVANWCTIGASRIAGTQYVVDGFFDMMAVYTRALSPATMADLYRIQ